MPSRRIMRHSSSAASAVSSGASAPAAVAPPTERAPLVALPCTRDTRDLGDVAAAVAAALPNGQKVTAAALARWRSAARSCEERMARAALMATYLRRQRVAVLRRRERSKRSGEGLCSAVPAQPARQAPHEAFACGHGGDQHALRRHCSTSGHASRRRRGWHSLVSGGWRANLLERLDAALVSAPHCRRALPPAPLHGARAGAATSPSSSAPPPAAPAASTGTSPPPASALAAALGRQSGREAGGQCAAPRG